MAVVRQEPARLRQQDPAPAAPRPAAEFRRHSAENHPRFRFLPRLLAGRDAVRQALLVPHLASRKNAWPTPPARPIVGNGENRKLILESAASFKVLRLLTCKLGLYSYLFYQYFFKKSTGLVVQPLNLVFQNLILKKFVFFLLICCENLLRKIRKKFFFFHCLFVIYLGFFSFMHSPKKNISYKKYSRG